MFPTHSAGNCSPDSQKTHQKTQMSSLVVLAASTLAIVATVFFATSFALKASEAVSNGARLVRSLNLSATGSINTRPDMATITTGIDSEAVKARDALDDNNDVMTRMMDKLRKGGLAERDIATVQFSVQPRYQRHKNGRPATVIGYRVSNTLSITVRNLDNLGKILDQLVTSGSNRMSGISFAISDPEKALDDARLKAMQKVLARADLYARVAGVRLGKITSISENANRYQPRPRMYRAKSMNMAASVPIAPGQHKTSVTVHVIWSLED